MPTERSCPWYPPETVEAVVLERGLLTRGREPAHSRCMATHLPTNQEGREVYLREHNAARYVEMIGDAALSRSTMSL